MVDFADGSTYNMHPKFLSLVAAADKSSEHRQVGKRAKARQPSSEKEDATVEESEESEEGSDKEEDERSDSDYGEEGQEEEGQEEEEHRHAREYAKAGAPSKGKKRAAPAGARTSKAAKAAKKKKNSASACQVRSERNTATANVAHGLPTNTVQFTKSNVVTHNSNRWHRRGEGLRRIRGFPRRVQETGSRESR